MQVCPPIQSTNISGRCPYLLNDDLQLFLALLARIEFITMMLEEVAAFLCCPDAARWCQTNLENSLAPVINRRLANFVLLRRWFEVHRRHQEYFRLLVTEQAGDLLWARSQARLFTIPGGVTAVLQIPDTHFHTHLQVARRLLQLENGFGRSRRRRADHGRSKASSIARGRAVLE